MDLLAVARVLRGRRILLAIGVLVAAAMGAVVGGVLPTHVGAGGRVTGEALARVLIDTRMPLVATTTQYGSDTITARTVLLASEMGSDAMTETIAHDASVPRDELAVLEPTFAPVAVTSILPAGELPLFAATAGQAAVQPYVVRLIADYSYPTIAVATVAPDVRQAQALAQATIAALRVATAQARGARGNANIEPIGSVHAAVVRSTTRTHHLLGVLALIAVFGLWCAGIVICAGVARVWRRAAAPAFPVTS